MNTDARPDGFALTDTLVFQSFGRRVSRRGCAGGQTAVAAYKAPLPLSILVFEKNVPVLGGEPPDISRGLVSQQCDRRCELSPSIHLWGLQQYDDVRRNQTCFCAMIFPDG